jgi:phage terminase large subunit-like protein
MARRAPAAVRIIRSKASPRYFCEEYLGPDSVGARLDMGTSAEWGSFQLHGLNRVFPGTNNRDVEIWPRFHAKTTLFSVGLPLYSAFVRRSAHYILLISQTDKLAKKTLERIRKELEGNKKLRSDFGIRTLTKKAEDEIEIDGEITIEAKGQGYQIRGFHPDLAVVDDLETDEIVSNPESLAKLKAWFWGPFFNILKPTSQVVVSGTILGDDSLLVDLWNKVEAKQGWTGVRLSSPVDKPIWPHVWTSERLAERLRDVGPTVFAHEFLNEPWAAEDKLFETVQTWEVLPPLELMYLYMSTDFAMSEKRTADFTAFIIVGVDGNGTVFVIDRKRGRWRPNRSEDELVEMFTRWDTPEHPIKGVGIEKHVIGDVMWEMIQNRFRKIERPIPLVKLEPENIRKYKRAQGIQPMVLSGRLKIAKNMDDVKQELLSYPGVHDDYVDCLAYLPKFAKAPPKLQSHAVSSVDDRPLEVRVQDVIAARFPKGVVGEDGFVHTRAPRTANHILLGAGW